jgi:hypothetical protein
MLLFRPINSSAWALVCYLCVFSFSPNSFLFLQSDILKLLYLELDSISGCDQLLGSWVKIVKHCTVWWLVMVTFALVLYDGQEEERWSWFYSHLFITYRIKIYSYTNPGEVFTVEKLIAAGASAHCVPTTHRHHSEYSACIDSFILHVILWDVHNIIFIFRCDNWGTEFSDLLTVTHLVSGRDWF